MAETEARDTTQTEYKNMTRVSSNIAALLNAMQIFQQQQIKIMTVQHREEMKQHREEMARRTEQLVPGQLLLPVTSFPFCGHDCTQV